MAWEGRVGLFARLPGWNPSGLPRSFPRQRRKTRRGPPDPPQRSPEPPLRKSSQGTKAPALQIPWFLCRPCRDKGTTTWHDEPDLDPVAPLWRSTRQRNHDWGARGAFVPLELWRGAFVLWSFWLTGAGGDLEPGRRLVGRGGVSLFTFCAAGAGRISERPEAIQPVRRVKRDTPPLHANPVPDYDYDYASAAAARSLADSMIARTAVSCPSRSRSIGSESPLTIPSKNSLRSW